VKKHLRQLGHNLKPSVTVAGKGLSEGVLAEVNRALDDHELVKVKLAIDDRDSRKALIAELERLCQVALIQEIGKVALIYRASTKEVLRTSRARQ
jgi:RNA-binding protein